MGLVDYIVNLPEPLLRHWGYWIMFFAACTEAAPLIGIFIPGQTIIMIGGFMARTNSFAVHYLILVASLGAIVGDYSGYVIGKRYGYDFLFRYGKYFFFNPEHLEKTKQLMHRHTGKTLVIGRFNSFTRALAPFVAGATQVPLGRFLLYNIIGGVSWGIVMVLVGYIFGASYEIASQYIGRIILVAVILSIAIVVVYRRINRKWHIYVRQHLKALILNVVCIYIFSKCLDDILKHEVLYRYDLFVHEYMRQFATGILTPLMRTVAAFSDPILFVLVALGFVGVLVTKRKWHAAFLTVAGLVGGYGLMELLKVLIHRARPAYSLVQESGFSFPSGHATLSIIFFSVLIYSFKDQIKSTALRILYIVVNVLLFLLIGVSRVYLNVHWMSDVIAGFALGLFWITLLVLVFKWIYAIARSGVLYAKSKLDQSVEQLMRRWRPEKT